MIGKEKEGKKGQSKPIIYTISSNIYNAYTY